MKNTELIQQGNIDNLSDIAERYDTYLIDAWGVLHDGGTVFPSALKCLQSLKAESKKVIILSNAARRTEAFNNELLNAGIDKTCFDFSLSSGELVWQNLKQSHYKYDFKINNKNDFKSPEKQSFKELGKHCYYLGPERSIGITHDLRLELVNSIDVANFILNTGAVSNQDSPLKYHSLLSIAVKKQLPMICANPDLVAIRKGVCGISAGAIATLYEDLGGEVVYTGKPYSQIYEICYEKLDRPAKNRILMIGDGLKTDIKGANDFGIDSVFIKQGIYKSQLEALVSSSSHNIANNEAKILQQLFVAEGTIPTFTMKQLNY